MLRTDLSITGLKIIGVCLLTDSSNRCIYRVYWYCPKCLHRDEPETCLDCDPFDPPCSLYENSEGWY